MSLSKISEVLWPAYDYFKQSLNIWKILGIGVATIVVVRVVRRPRNLPPGPKGLPLVGAITELSEEMHKDVLNLSHKYNSDIISFYVMGKLMVILNSHRAIKEAFMTMGDTFADRPKSNIAYYMNFKDEIFTAPYSKEWTVHKKFAMQNLRMLGFGTPKSESHIQTEIDELLMYLSDHTGEAIEIRIPVKKALANVVCQIICSKRYEFDDPELDNLLKGTLDMFKCFSGSAFLLDFFPVWFTKIFLRPIVNQVSQDSNILREYLDNQIEEHRTTLDPSNPRDLVDVYLKERSDLDKETIIGTILMFLPDSFMTVEAAFSWIMLYLVSHQDILIKLQSEIDKVCGSARKPSLADRSNMPYTEAVIREAFRKMSINAMTALHKPIKDVTLLGYHIPEDSMLMANLYAVHNDPELFPDPNVFKPERLIDSDGGVIKLDTVMPFGLGTRSCVGEQLTKTQIFLFLTGLLQRFQFRLPDDQPQLCMEPKGVVLRDPPPYKVIATPR